MSCLTIHADDAPGVLLTRTEDATSIATELSRIGVRFERWHSPVPVAADSDAETILACYQPFLDTLIGPHGAGSADVIKLTPDHPDAAALRKKFLAEHTHTEDEVRFFVEGGGNFILHQHGRIYDAHCVAGDLISVPAGIPHWFDAGEQPYFTVLRVFTDPSGWVPHFTGARLDRLFPASR